jgi:hypothetical protein
VALKPSSMLAQRQAGKKEKGMDVNETVFN